MKMNKTQRSREQDKNSGSLGQAVAQRQTNTESQTAGLDFQDNRSVAIDQMQLQLSIDQSPREKAKAERIAGLFGSPMQQQTIDGHEEPLQSRFETVQQLGAKEDEPLQGRFAQGQAVQLEDADTRVPANRTGMPDPLKAGVEALSGMDLSDVRVHHNSDKPAQVNALAYAQGNEIHLGSGQEQHLPHEAWHVVQQRQGRVRPTMQMAGVQVNDDETLEREADLMGGRAMQMKGLVLDAGPDPVNNLIAGQFSATSNVLQAKFDDEDIAKMKQVAAGDETLTNILKEVLDIHNQMPEDLNYGVSTKGGHAALNPQGKGQIVVKDERWALTKKIKNYFNAYGMEHDIKRQSMIIHELTHLAELYTNLPSKDGVVPEDQRPKNDKELAMAMEPDPELVDSIYKQKNDVEKLLTASSYEDEMKEYLRGRLEYGFAINAENPTVFTEISYYLKAKGKSGTPFYNKITEFADAFYKSRLARKTKQED